MRQESATRNGPLQGVLTVDLEDWRGALTPSNETNWRKRPPVDESEIREMTKEILNKLDRLDTKATFFVVGEVIDCIPEILKEISRKGHEIASHSPIHVPPRMIPRDEFVSLLRRDVTTIENVTGRRPLGFRAPYFSVSKTDGWMMRVLRDLGLLYDSSVFPTWTPLYGIPTAPRTPYFPDFEDISKSMPMGPILEIPVTVWPTRGPMLGLPIGGGFFMRIWPIAIQAFLLDRVAESGSPVVIYLHLSDIQSPEKGALRLRPRDRIIRFLGSKKGDSAFEAIAKGFRLGSIRSLFRTELDVAEIESKGGQH
jgi:polysaccharide deacetylase family protein (PEP-CTERM system associated)